MGGVGGAGGELGEFVGEHGKAKAMISGAGSLVVLLTAGLLKIGVKLREMTLSLRKKETGIETLKRACGGVNVRPEVVNHGVQAGGFIGMLFRRTMMYPRRAPLS